MISFYQYKLSILSQLLFVLVSFLGFYPALVRALRVKSNYENINFIQKAAAAIILAILYLALSGIFLALLPMGFARPSAIIIIVLPMVIGLYNVKILSIRATYADFSIKKNAAFFLIWLMFVSLILLLASVNPKLADNLPDGAYVNKEHVAGVKIQKITGNLPADNVIPFVAEEYLARGISFGRNSPILPGQVVSNRPILVSLVALPFRLAIAKVRPLSDLPTYTYVNTEWPDFRILLRDEAAFSVFLGIGVVLNSLLLPGILLFSTSIKEMPIKYNYLIMGLFITSPYFVFQTLFTWPKSFAGFFVLSALFWFLKYRQLFLPAFLLGLAFLAHPSSLPYFIVGCLLLFLDFSASSAIKVRRLSVFGLTFGLVLLPWFLWTRLIIEIPSDLVVQNINMGSASLYQLVWFRLANVMNAVFPTHLLGHGMNFVDAYIASSTNLPGATGMVVSLGIMMLSANKLLNKNQRLLDLYQSRADIDDLKVAVIFCLLSCGLLSLLFSYPTPILMHGMQPLAALLLVVGVFLASLSGKYFLKLIWAQIILNSAMLTGYLIKLV